MTTLALLGGKPVIAEPLPVYRSIGRAEIDAVVAVMEDGCLSGFYGSHSPKFFGGPKVRELEAAWSARYHVRHAVTVNSATSGLIAAMGALALGPGDEVIVTPWSMSASAVAPLFVGAIPVFADIEDETFGLDPAAVEASITPRTRAIIAVNLFGHPARWDELRAVARRHGLALVEDNAQAPLAADRGRPCGTLGDIGVFSLNYHKHIHSGEGGVCVTDDDALALRLQLIRNHGENVVEPMAVDDIVDIVGHNFRLSEMSAAVAIEQLRRIDLHVERRERVAAILTDATAGLEGLIPPAVRAGCRHNYYMWALRCDPRILGVSRNRFAAALAAEGVPNACGYVRPLYGLPLFRRRTAWGRHGFPFTLSDRTYPDNLCPVAERLQSREAILFQPPNWDIDDALAHRLAEALHKVHRHRAELAGE